MERVPQSVGLRVPLKAYLSSDHVSPATGKTLAVVISKNGSSFANPSAGSVSATEISNGWYYVDLSATDTGTTGPLLLRATSSGVDDVEPQPYNVVDPNNAGFLGVPAVAAGASGGLPTGNSSGQVTVGAIAAAATNIKKNTGLNHFEFTMTDSTTGAFKTGVTVTGQVSIDGAAVASLTNSVTEVSNGIYQVNLAAADVNGNVITLLFTGTGSNPTIITLITQP